MRCSFHLVYDVDIASCPVRLLSLSSREPEHEAKSGVETTNLPFGKEPESRSGE